MSERQGIIMLVEDSPTQAARLQRFFEADNLEVVQVSSAELALEQLERLRPDAIVLDYNLPGMSGNQFCREIRMNVNTRSIPVLMLTAEKGESAEMQGLESGADDYLVKSADPDILRVRVRALLRRAEEAGPQKRESGFNRVRLLAIDDSPTYLGFLEQELKKEHFFVQTASSPEEGLRLLRNAPFDCALVDFEMPGLNGAEVCRQIRGMRGEPNSEIVLIILSSQDDKQRMTMGFEAGADDYIAKSADFSLTKARIRALVRRKFLIDESRRIGEELRTKELEALRASAAREAAEVRAVMADQLAAANQQLDRANQELELFAYAAAHDLREPLRQVSIYAQLLRQYCQGKFDAQAEQFVDGCVDGAARMESLIDGLLSYGRASRETTWLNEPTDLNLILETALSNLKTSIEETGGVVQSSPLPLLYVAPVVFQQVFQNLIGNAIKYRSADRAPEVYISARREAEEWIFCVSDNGIGIAREYWEKVFQLFERLDANNSSGAGLGLAITRRIIENLGGRIWVQSEDGIGSQFLFALPAALALNSSATAT